MPDSVASDYIYININREGREGRRLREAEDMGRGDEDSVTFIWHDS